jgi:hypothetical protein
MKRICFLGVVCPILCGHFTVFDQTSVLTQHSDNLEFTNTYSVI